MRDGCGRRGARNNSELSISVYCRAEAASRLRSLDEACLASAALASEGSADRAAQVFKGSCRVVVVCPPRLLALCNLALRPLAHVRKRKDGFFVC